MHAAFPRVPFHARRHLSGVVLTAAAAIAGSMALAGCGSKPASLVLDQADAAYGAQDYALAAERYQEYLDMRPGRSEVIYRLGLSLEKAGDLEQARVRYELAHRLEPESHLYADAYARVLRMQGRYSEMFTFVDQLRRRRGDAADYLRVGREALAAGPQAGYMDEVEPALRTASALFDSREVEAHRLLARYYRAVNRDDLEMRRHRVVIFLAPGDPESYERLRALGEVPGPSMSLPPSNLGDRQYAGLDLPEPAGSENAG